MTSFSQRTHSFSRPPSSSTSSELLPPECSLHVFSYLHLKDVLSYGAASLSSMKEVLPDLNRRRSRMNRRFAYWKDWKATSAGREMPEQTGNIALWDDVGRIHHQDQDSGNNRRDESASSPSSTAGGAVEDAVAAAGGWVALPSVQERVEQLCLRMPAFHRLRTNVQALKQELLDHQNEQLLLNAPLSFSVLFAMHQKIMLPLKLHASILYGVIHSDPWLASTGLDQSNESTSLDQYMGDVFALTFLMSFSDLGIVEGGPTNAACVRQLRQRQPPSSEASQCYRSWVYMHSSVLRVKTFTQEQQVRLGIPSELCQVSEMIPNDCYLSEVFMTSEISLKIHEFGRLGPSFRGWDVPRVRELSARCLFAFFVTDNVHFQGETTRTAMEWLCLVHDQARKTRPMTVTPPSIRLCRPNVRS